MSRPGLWMTIHAQKWRVQGLQTYLWNGKLCTPVEYPKC